MTATKKGPPVPVLVHVVGASLYCLLGAFQFARGFRRRRPGWHRTAGRLLVPCGLAAALSGQVLTHLPWILLVGKPGGLSRALLMLAGWVINLAVTEWALRKRPPRSARTRT